MVFPWTMVLFCYFIIDLGIDKNFSTNIFIVDLIFRIHQLYQPHLINIVAAGCLSTPRKVMKHHPGGVKKKSKGSERIKQLLFFSRGLWVQCLWWALDGTLGNTSVLSFRVFQVLLCSTIVGLKLIRPRSLSNSGWTMASSNTTSKESASSWGIKEPSRTLWWWLFW